MKTKVLHLSAALILFSSIMYPQKNLLFPKKEKILFFSKLKDISSPPSSYCMNEGDCAKSAASSYLPLLKINYWWQFDYNTSAYNWILIDTIHLSYYTSYPNTGKIKEEISYQNYKTAYRYNTNGLMLSKTFYYYYYYYNDWYAQNRDTFIYVGNKLSQHLQQYRDTTGWNTQTATTYTYNSSNLVTQIRYSSTYYNPPTLSPYTQDIIGYNSVGQYTVITDQDYDLSTNSFTNTYQYHLYYTSNKPTKIIYFQYNPYNANWDTIAKATYTWYKWISNDYLQMDKNLISSAVLYERQGNGNYVNSAKIVTSYDITDDAPILEEYFEWQNNQWVKTDGTKHIYTRNPSYGNAIIEDITQHWQDSSGYYVNYSKIVYDDLSLVGIKELMYQDNILIYPNPAAGLLYVNIPFRHQSAILSLTDNLGNLIMEKKSIHPKEIINISNLPNGLYILSLDIDGQRFYRKITVQN